MRDQKNLVEDNNNDSVNGDNILNCDFTQGGRVINGNSNLNLSNNNNNSNDIYNNPSSISTPQNIPLSSFNRSYDGDINIQNIQMNDL